MARKMTKWFRKGRRWFSKWIMVIGMATAVLGTLFMTSANVQFLSCIPNMLSQMDKREAAWAMLTDFVDPAIAAFRESGNEAFADFAWGVKDKISVDEKGFTELLRTIRNKMNVPTEVIGIQISVGGYTSSGEQLIGVYDVELEHPDQIEAFIVAGMSDVAGWIRDERVKWGNTWGFLTLMIGLVITLIVEICRTLRTNAKPRERTSCRG